MAGIEKVCEFSGEYPGGAMYSYKRNHIQIMPKYRKLFRNATACLEIVSSEQIIQFKRGGCTSYNKQDLWCREFAELHGNKVLTEYTFKLVVSDEKLKGEVDGEYYNYTTNLKDTIKRLKRMLRNRNLKVKYNLKENK